MSIGIIGSGYIGYNLAAHLHALGADVATFSRTPAKVHWVHEVDLHQARITFKKSEVVVVCSGNTNKPGITYESEKTRTLEIAQLLDHANLRKLIYVSSGAVYGNCDKPMAEIDTCKPLTNYGKIKLGVENDFLSLFKSRAVIARLSNPYSSLYTNGIFSSFIQATKSKNIFNLQGDLTDCRDYLSILSASEMLTSLSLQNNRENIYNACSGVSLTLGELRQVMQDASQIEVQSSSLKNRRQEDVPRTIMDSSRIHEEFNLGRISKAALLADLKSLLLEMLSRE